MGLHSPLELGRKRQVELCGLKARLVYKETSRTARPITQRNPKRKKKKHMSEREREID